MLYAQCKQIKLSIYSSCKRRQKYQKLVKLLKKKKNKFLRFFKMSLKIPVFIPRFIRTFCKIDIVKCNDFY